jgi:hypothetical protein
MRLPLSTDPEIRAIQTEPCSRCGHGGHWHRLDDATNLGPCDPGARFRCLGPAFVGCPCPDMVRASIVG